MEEQISKFVSLAGNQHRYQYFMAFICFLFWADLTMLNFSLGFLENKPLISFYDKDKNETTVESMEYDHCDWDANSFTVVETYNFSWVIDLGLECEKLKVSMIGTLASGGSLLGAITYSFYTKKFGERKVILVANVFFMVVILISIFVNYYGYFLATVLLGMMSMNIIEYSVFVIISSIIVKNKKSIFSTSINSALGIGGIFYVLMFLAFKNWKYVFVVSISIAVVLEIITFFFFVDSLEQYVLKKDYDGFMKAIRFIAKFNGKLDTFEKEIQKDEYQDLLKKLRGDFILVPISTPRSDIMHTPQLKGNEPENKESSENNHKQETLQNDVYIHQKATTHTNTIELQTIPSSNSQTDESHPKEEIKKWKKPKINALCLIKYPSIRYTFLLLCLLWFCTMALMSGLTIGVKSLPGNIYVNTLLLYCAETPGYFISGIAMNSKALGRKYSLMLFTGGFAVMCLMLVILFNYNTPTIVFYLLTRFFCMSAFCIYYTFCLESYPLSINQLAYGINGACNSVGGMVIPFIVEYISRRILYLIYCIFGVVCCFLMIFLKETNGKPIPDQIKEIEDEEKLNQNNGIPVVVV